ncbi:hypothetical protein Goshw_002227 [Gossypium schwendimanii]|uniref:RNase H type-1 domain-containing protein n=1 Tax=Gossypium schwendimanii TaxID=34291 RepID=A0A7J9LDK0_GOSSC|nr:hypothetical protein [Gossypium schwendimanii]
MRVTAMNSVWLREEKDGELQEMNQGPPNLWRNLRDRIKRESGMTINPILGFNLEGVMSSDFMNYGESLKGLAQMDMAHDLEESSIESTDGKKRPRMDSLDPNVSNTADLLVFNDEQSIAQGKGVVLQIMNAKSSTDPEKYLGLLNMAVEMGLEMDLSTVEVEGDALSVIKKIQNNGEDKSKICAYIKDVQQLKKGFQICWFKHSKNGRHGGTCTSYRRTKYLFLSVLRNSSRC